MTEKQTPKSDEDQARPESLCGTYCPTAGCGKPCRGYAGHALPHECNRHHKWS